MASLFTEHVRNFRPDAGDTERVLAELERLLKRRMRRRNLLSAPPAYLGYGGPSWYAEDAFDDILHDCYIFAILERIEALQNQLRARDNIDGLIVRNVDNFLLERQRKHDPIGYAVFGNLDAAVRLAQTAGRVDVEGLRQGRVRNQVLLRITPRQPDAALAEPEQLREIFAADVSWRDALPNMVRISEEGQEWVIGFLEGLRTAGVAAIRCGDLLAVLGARARADWVARHADHPNEFAWEGEDEAGQLVRMLAPDTVSEDRDHWERQKQDLLGRIARLDRQRRVRDRLTRVVGALFKMIEEGGAEPPRQAELARRLAVPKTTLSDDFRLLADLLGDAEEET
jgi:hypothetical protein